MKYSFFAGRLAAALCMTALLLYFAARTASPKIIFVPFLLCSIAMAGKYAALLLRKQHAAVIFDRLFTVGFFVFWFGFLAVVGYVSMRDDSKSLLILSLPFWIAGLFIAKKRLL